MCNINQTIPNINDDKTQCDKDMDMYLCMHKFFKNIIDLCKIIVLSLMLKVKVNKCLNRND